MSNHSNSNPPPASLETWPLNHPARILAVEPPENDVMRLKAMGLCEGRVVTLLRRGNPVVAQVYRTRIALAPELAHRIKVVACPNPL